VCDAIPPWADLHREGPYEFVILYAALLAGVALSYQALRLLRLRAAAYPFVVMFLVTLLSRVALRSPRPDLALQIRESADWAALFGALFTVLWWIAIRKRRVSG
jgi:hypothetical protein